MSGQGSEAFTQVADAGNRAGDRGNNHVVNLHYVSDNNDNQIEEVINGDNNDPWFRAITGRLLNPADRQ